MRNTELYPELHQNRGLVKQLTAFFAKQPTVYEVAVFGSLAADTADRWSAVDLIVVTAHTQDQPTTFAALRDHTPIVYHRPFLRDPNGPGAYVSGILLDGFSPFHLANLHFLTLAERRLPDISTRYYGVRTLHQMMTTPLPPPPQASAPPTEAETVDEARVYDAASNLLRALRQVLRQQGDPATLGEPRAVLDNILANHLDGLPTPHGDVCTLAKHYLSMTDMLLNAEHETND